MHLATSYDRFVTPVLASFAAGTPLAASYVNLLVAAGAGELSDAGGARRDRGPDQDPAAVAPTRRATIRFESFSWWR